MESNPKIGKANGGAVAIASIVGFLFKLAVFATVVTLIMIYVFGMGGWTFKALNGMRVVDLCSFALKASVLTGIAYSAVFKPLALVAQNSIKKKVLYADLVGLTSDDVQVMRFLERMLNTTTACAVAAGVVAGAIALLSHDPLMDALSNPAADIVTLLIIVIGPYLLAALFVAIGTGGLRKENPELYQLWMQTGL